MSLGGGEGDHDQEQAGLAGPGTCHPVLGWACWGQGSGEEGRAPETQEALDPSGCGFTHCGPHGIEGSSTP